MRSIRLGGVLHDGCSPRWTDGKPTLPITHRALADMLAVQRTTITLVLRMMSSAGLIRHERGSIAILDRSGLEELTCECYGIIKRVYDEAHSAH